MVVQPTHHSPNSRLILLVISIVICTGQRFTVTSVAQQTGFLSIDCGTSRVQSYTDPSTGIIWTPDITIWPNIGNWSTTTAAAIGLPTEMPDQVQYSSFRSFPSVTSSKALNQSKFCYNLPATGNNYYLVRASFWYDPAAASTGQIRFRVIVDTYTGVEIVIDLPQKNPWFEEMYVRAQSRGNISLCLAPSSTSQVESISTGSTVFVPPFINSLEIRPLPRTMNSVTMIGNTNTAMRTVRREDSGTSVPGILRYPNDTLDRLWWAGVMPAEFCAVSSRQVAVNNNSIDLPPPAVMNTNGVPNGTSGYTFNISSPRILTTATIKGSHRYYMVLWFAEFDLRVNASGQRVFNLRTNDDLFSDWVDVYRLIGPYTALEISTKLDKPLGPYTDKFLISSATAGTSIYQSTLAAAEILQLFNVTMDAVTPTSASDVSAIAALVTSCMVPPSNLKSFMGDPCLPVAYKYPWIGCASTSSPAPAATRVTSIFLSNYGLVGRVPDSIGTLDQLETLDLSNNSLTGRIPESLSGLSKLKYLDIRNNNFTGKIPSSLLQMVNAKQLDFRYDGNPFLCPNPNNTAYCAPPSPSKLPLIIGLVAGAVVLAIAICILVIICKRRKRTTPFADLRYRRNNIGIQPSGARDFPYQEIVAATRNFSTILGRGGFGIVYKGTFEDGTAAAIKVLSDASQQGTRQFLTEVNILSRVHHRNLVRLLGYCTEPKLVLVYEYMPNGSLYDCLFSRNSSSLPTPLTWIQRLQILLGAARGLAYLHASCKPRIIHMDVKSSNILMDEALEGKMSDFGISRQNFNSGELATKLVATRGYVDPEFALTLLASEKVDVYSFGVVILEALCGQQPFIKEPGQDPSDAVHIVDWARNYYQRGDIEGALFHGIGGNYNDSAVWKVAEIAMRCVEDEGRKRPSMDEVCSELSEALILETSYHGHSNTVTEEQLLRPTADTYIMAR